MPDKANNKVANGLVLEVLMDHGDALTVSREIDHWAYFPTPEARSRFLETCLNAGFKLRYTSEPNDLGSKFGAVIWHIDTPSQLALDQVTGMLIDLAESGGGEYDGWETQLLD